MGNRTASKIRNFNTRRIKKGFLVRVPQKVKKPKNPGWKDLTYRKVEIVPHEKGVTRYKGIDLSGSGKIGRASCRERV